LQKRSEVIDGNDASDGGRGGANHGHANLHNGQQALGISLERIDQNCTRVPLAHQLGDPALSNGDDGEFGTGKEAVDDNKQENDNQLDENCVQISSKVISG
jgi:hypothetical protein